MPARHHGINPKPVAKWRKRCSTTDLTTGPKAPRSTVLSLEPKAMIVAFGKHALLPRNDCLYALQDTIPGLARSSLHRCLERHGISRLPEVEGDRLIKRNSTATRSASSTDQTAPSKTPTVERSFYDSHRKRKARLLDFITAYNFERRLTTLKELTPYERLCS